MRTPLFLLVVLLVGLFVLQGVSAATYTTDTITATAPNTTTSTVGWGPKFTMKTNATLTNVTLFTGDNSARVRLFASDGTTVLATASTSGGVATFNYNLTNGSTYFLIAGSSGASRTTTAVTSGASYPQARTNLNYIGRGYVTADGASLTTYTDAEYDAVKSIQTCTPTGCTETNIITASLSNTVNGSSFGSVTFTNVSGNLTFNYFNITGTGFCVTYTGNGTGTNCTSGSGASTYYNVSNTTTITGSTMVTASTYAALLNITARQVLSNASISAFNITNALLTNTTTGGSLLVPANNGSNNVKVDVAGNYSLNATCTGASLSVSSCVITGIYDNIYTVGARNSTSGISTFSVTVSNSTIGSTSGSTTNGSYVFPLLQGYQYNFQMNASGYALDNETLAANASTNLYNFTLYTMNTFNLVFRNESTNTIISGQNITVQLISDAFSNNYTTSNGLLNVSLLTPDAYTIRYWLDSSVPRDYYTTLTPQSIQDLDLYVLDAGISSLYLPIIKDQNGRAISDATVKLLRYYILSSNTGEYETVEMSKTDTNGQAVLRVVPNIINYKLIITKDGKTLTTTPTKFTSTTNTYTLNTQSSPLTSIANIEGVSQSLTYNGGTQTFVFTWNDDNGIVSSGCLKVTKFSNTITEVMDECGTGSAGSLIYTVTDTNQTQYKAQSTINTNTPYSSYSDIIDMDFRTKYQVWGTIGLFLTLIVFLTFSFMGAGNTETTVMYGVGAIFLMGAFGVIFGNYQSIIGIIIIAGIIIYKTRT